MYKLKFVISLIFIMALTIPGLAQATIPNVGLEFAENFELAGTDEDPRDALVNVVRYLMTFLALIAVTVILVGGLRYMISMGNEDRIAMAKKTLSSGFVGLVFILISFALVQFVINTTSNVIAEGAP